jgi:methyl-accepting chemotaxis protein
MSTDPNLTERLDFLLFRAEDRDRAARHSGAFARAIPRALEAFYAHVARTPALSRLFGSPDHMTKTKDLQAAHWQTLASVRLDDAYLDRARHIGQVHARSGLEPRWYLGGYALVLTEMVREMLPTLTCGAPWSHRKREAEATWTSPSRPTSPP